MTKASFRYQIKDQVGAAVIFYIVITGLCCVAKIISMLPAYKGDANIQGQTGMSIFFLFILGLCSFWEYFAMSLQNGVSRRAMFRARIGTTLVMALICVPIDLLLDIVFGTNAFLKGSLYAFMYSHGQSVTFLTVLQQILWMFLIFVFVQCLGYAITIMYYRLKVPGIIAVSVGVPAAVIYLAVNKTSYISKALGHTLITIVESPLWSGLAAFILSLLLTLAAWLMIRRANVK